MPGSRPRSRLRPKPRGRDERARRQRRPRPLRCLRRRRHPGRRDARSRARPARDRGRRRGRHRRRSVAAARTRWHGSCASRRGGRCCVAAPTTPIRSSACWSPTPNSSSSSRDRGPGAAAAADRPMPGRGVRRRHRPRAVPHQDRPRAPRRARRDLRAVSICRSCDRGRPGFDAGGRDAARRSSPIASRCSSDPPASESRRWSTRWCPMRPNESAMVSERTGKGQHTTTAAIALPLPDGGWVVDTPGIRSFGLAHVEPRPAGRVLPRSRRRAPRSARATATTSTRRSASSTTGSRQVTRTQNASTRSAGCWSTATRPRPKRRPRSSRRPRRRGPPSPPSRGRSARPGPRRPSSARRG